ncbi:MAG: hypothetical protein HQK53_15165 [Oligoflexia bacterium]|nr:hypothetical protein [Oligoflexia bacterium]
MIATLNENNQHAIYGDVVYLDRGRADGVEVGNIFEVFSSEDEVEEKNITNDPTYKIGELTVITLSDNFATALVTYSAKEIPLGTIVTTKTKASAMLAQKFKKDMSSQEIKKLENKAMENVEVDLNLDDINKNILEKAEKEQLTDEEMNEVSRQEREKSFLEKEEKDLKELERLEKEVENAETELKSAKLDEDKILQDEDLNTLEKKTKATPREVLDAVNEIEKKEGKRFLDEDLNSKDNPYGLSPLDVEEIDELMHSSKNSAQQKKKRTVVE